MKNIDLKIMEIMTLKFYQESKFWVKNLYSYLSNMVFKRKTMFWLIKMHKTLFEQNLSQNLDSW